MVGKAAGLPELSCKKWNYLYESKKILPLIIVNIVPLSLHLSLKIVLGVTR